MKFILMFIEILRLDWHLINNEINLKINNGIIKTIKPL